jgi:hypothetical protein
MKGWFYQVPKDVEDIIYCMVTELRKEELMAEIRWTGGYQVWKFRPLYADVVTWAEYGLYNENWELSEIIQ